MWPTSARLREALRTGYGLSTIIRAQRGGAHVPATLIAVSGQVTVQAGTGVRRRLSVELEPVRGLWDLLSPAGTTLTCTTQVRFADGSSESVPLGVFDVDEQRLSHSPGGGVQITAPDRWVNVTRRRFERPHVTNGNAITEAARLMTEANPGSTAVIQGSSNAQTRRAVWDRDRDQAVVELVRAAGWEGYFDPMGVPTLRPVPRLAGPPAWRVDAGRAGVMLTADRVRSRQETRNVVVVTADDVDGEVPFAPVTVADTDPDSPTSVARMGRVPAFYSSELIRTALQAQIAGRALLDQLRGLAASLTLTAAPNPALEVGDVIEVVLPRRDGDFGQRERHVVDSLTVPLTASGVQQISTRSTLPQTPDGVQ